jgi:hypothetical protein
MVSAVFFLRRQLLFDGAGAADLLIHVQQLLRQPTKAVIRLHLSLRLEPFGLTGKGFGDGLSVVLTGEAKVGAVSGMMGLMAVARRLAAGAPRGGDRSAAKVGQSDDFLEDVAALLLQLVERFRHGISPEQDIPSCPHVLIR